MFCWATLNALNLLMEVGLIMVICCPDVESDATVILC